MEQPCAGASLTQSSPISYCNNYVDEDLAWQTTHSGQKYTVINFCDLKAQTFFGGHTRGDHGIQTINVFVRNDS